MPSLTFPPILILTATLALVGILVYAVQLAARGDWRASLIRASVLVGALVVAISEGLGALNALNSRNLALAWALVASAAGFLCLRRPSSRWVRPAGAHTPPRAEPLSRISLASKLCLSFVALQVVALVIVAWAAAPNTWDSMTYHLSRVVHWQQNQNLQFYPTSIQRQLAFGPWAELAMLQFQALTNGDRLANFVQLFALLGCAVGASYVADRLGAARRGQAFAALAVITLPMAILQSTSTQNDLVISFWCIAAVALVLEADVRPVSPATAACLGAALGLAALTKATAFVVLTPLVVWYVLSLLMRLRLRALSPLVITGTVAVLLLVPHALRNHELYGNLLGVAPGPELYGYTNEVIGVRSLISNSVRSVGLQLAVPWDAANGAVEGLLRAGHHLMGIDPDDPATTWQRSRFSVLFSMYEDNAGNPAHLLLLLAGIVLTLRNRPRTLVISWVCWLTSGLLFSLVLKWQPWSGRLVLPLLIWGAILAAVQLSHLLNSDRVFLPGLLLGVVALPYVLVNPTRPLIGAKSVLTIDRIAQYFTNVPDNHGAYAQAASMITEQGCHDIGLLGTPETREYLLWVTNRAVNPEIRIEHVLVKNPSRRYAGNFQPCALVVTYPYDEPVISINGVQFAERLRTERFHLYLPAGNVP